MEKLFIHVFHAPNQISEYHFLQVQVLLLHYTVGVFRPVILEKIMNLGCYVDIDLLRRPISSSLSIIPSQEISSVYQTKDCNHFRI